MTSLEIIKAYEKEPYMKHIKEYFSFYRFTFYDYQEQCRYYEEIEDE